MRRTGYLLAILWILITNHIYAQKLTREKATEDIKFAVKKLKELHPNPFYHISKKDFDAAVKKSLFNLSENNSSRHLQSEVARLLALVHDSHTRCNDKSLFLENYWKVGGKIFPIHLNIKNNTVQVYGVFGGADPNSFKQIKNGHVLTAINDVPIGSVIDLCMQYISGDSDYEKYVRLQRHFYFYLWQLYGPQEFYVLSLVDNTGNSYTETVRAIVKKNSPENDDKTQQQQNPFSFNFYNDNIICLFNAPTFNSSKWKTFRQTLDQCLNEMHKKQTKIFIVDLRNNGGGHSGLGQELLQKTTNKSFKSESKYNKTVYSLAFAFKQKHEKNWLAFQSTIKPIDSPWKGQVVLLCGPETSSSAVTTAALGKDNNIAIIAGQETGGRASAFSEFVTIELPNSKLKCDISTCYFLRPDGFDNGKGVLPDIPVDISLPNEKIIEKIEMYLSSLN